MSRKSEYFRLTEIEIESEIAFARKGRRDVLPLVAQAITLLDDKSFMARDRIGAAERLVCQIMIR